MKRRLSYLWLLLALGGCTAPAILPPLSPHHPASPDAAEGYIPPLSSTLDSTAAVPKVGEQEAPKHEHHGNQSADQEIYTCPMHPEVIQASPGKCPKCGMKLVKKPLAEGGKK